MTRPILLALLLMIWPFTSIGSSWETEPSETEVGVHTISNFGEEEHLVSTTISEQAIRDALRGLDWVGGFHQVVVVTSRGVSMEVGGSLDPEHGLSAMYRNRADRVDAVILNPPETVEEMEAILLAFIRKGDSWRQEYEYIQALLSLGLTIHSSRTRFAGRLNSGVRPMSHISSYFNSVADSITAAGARSGSSTHRPSIGTNREIILKDFLAKHLPRRLTASLGGQVISHDSDATSRQIDILVTNDLGVRFDENELTLVTAESVASCISVKSNLDTASLNDALENLLSVPDPSTAAISFPILVNDPYTAFLQRHPTYYVFAYDGFSGANCQSALNDFMRRHPDTPLHRLPKAVIVNSRYLISFSRNERTEDSGARIPANSFHWADISGDRRGYSLCTLLSDISSYASWLNHMDTSIYPYFNAGYGIAER